VLARVEEVDAEQSGILKVGCVGGQRVRLSAARQQDDGLWLADAQTLQDDEQRVPPPSSRRTVAALSKAIESLRSQGQHPFREPYRLNDTGWVANRWCEILPISLAASRS